MEEKTMQVMKGMKPNAVNWIGALIGAALAWWTGMFSRLIFPTSSGKLTA